MPTPSKQPPRPAAPTPLRRAGKPAAGAASNAIPAAGPDGRRCWLMKSEPDSFGIADLERKGTAPWDGVRNYTSRNFLRAMAVNDQVLFYHSSATPSGIAGLAQVVRTAYADHTSWDPASAYFDAKSSPENPRWSMVDVRYLRTFPRLLPLEALRRVPELAGMLIFHNTRLSVTPVANPCLDIILRLAAG
jgi:predicted RNA-binding protein with PUA-like domain